MILQDNDSSDIDLDIEEFAFFSKLAPAPEINIPKKTTLSWLGQTTSIKESKKNKKKNNKQRQSTRERSRSRERNYKNTFSHVQVKVSEEAIVISDDEEEQMRPTIFNKFASLERDLYKPIQDMYKQCEGLDRNKKRKIDRMFERGLRYFREGKPRDRLSNQIFNTIEEYFR